jgi:hypothetical protein
MKASCYCDNKETQILNSLPHESQTKMRLLTAPLQTILFHSLSNLIHSISHTLYITIVHEEINFFQG